MDLINRLAQSINANVELPTKLLIGYLQPDEALGLYALPGSATINEDWAGNQTRSINFEIAIRTSNAEKGYTAIWNISSYLDTIEDLKSADGSYQFDSLTQTSYPNNSDQDDKGYSICSLDFNVVVLTKLNRE